MGNTDSKLSFRKAFLQLASKSSQIESNDDEFWEQFWTESDTSICHVFSLVSSQEVRQLRDENPANLATFTYKAVERLVQTQDTLCNTTGQQTTVLNSCRLLTRILPFLFEDEDWKSFMWSNMYVAEDEDQDQDGDEQVEGQRRTPSSSRKPLGKALIHAVCDLLFCPEFTVAPLSKGPDMPEDLQSVDSCEYIWEPGIGFMQAQSATAAYHRNRMELLRLIVTCFSETMYESGNGKNRWISLFASSENRHALPLFTSLVNTVFSYDPSGGLLPFNHLIFHDSKESLVEAALQILVVTLDQEDDENLFINYLARIHREDDFQILLNGFTRLLRNPLIQTYLPNSVKKLSIHQELLILFWKCCDHNKKFMYYVLKTSDVLDIVVPILYHLNENRSDASRIGLVHIGVFILLLLSGERNFGVRLNKPYTPSTPMDLPIFSGTHADLLIVVFHKIITTGHQRLQPLFDCLLTIIVNVSPYLKTLSMVSATKLLHLMEAFSTPWFLYSSPTNNHLVFFLLEVFNNIIQYQFDGNSNLVYTIIRKRNVFHALANLPTDPGAARGSGGGGGTHAAVKRSSSKTFTGGLDTSAVGDLVSLAATPRIESMTEKTHPEPDEPEGEDGGDEDKSQGSSTGSMSNARWQPTSEWIQSWKQKLPLQTIMRMLQVLVPQVEKMCIDKGITDENEILKFLQHGTLVGLLPVPHPILIRKYQTNASTTLWFRTYMWGIIYLRNANPPIWFDTNVRLFEIQKI